MDLASPQSLVETKHGFFSGIACYNEFAQEWVKEGRDTRSC